MLRFGNTESEQVARGWITGFEEKVSIGLEVFTYAGEECSEKIPDFNLDGDRGVGYLCWRKVKDDTALNDPAAPTVAVLPSETVKHVQTDIISPNSSTIL